MSATCCPLYTIRCDAQNFQPSKSQRKVVKKINNFLKKGKNSDAHANNDDGRKEEKGSPIENSQRKVKENLSEKTQRILKPEKPNTKPFEVKKAKLIRREKYIEKMIRLGKEIPHDGTDLNRNKIKGVAELVGGNNLFALNQKILQSEPESVHKFEIRLVRADLRDKEFMKSFQQSYKVYMNYQTIIHKDSPEDCDVQTFASFLCDSPLIYEEKEGIVLGAFHQQYLVDDAIVAVGVIDILPNCLSSVYLYYDPLWWAEGSNLSPGTYTALREVQFTQELKLPYYYMGYYVHSCPKMRYKGQFQPSDLLSPSLLSWHNIKDCIPNLEVSKYSTFEDAPIKQSAPKKQTADVGKTRLCVEDKVTTYETWSSKHGHSEEVVRYHKLVGQALAESLVLRWGGNDFDSESED